MADDMATMGSNALTIEDLEALPEDGKRYELIGGAIVMTPSPIPAHQRVSRRLQDILEELCPDGYEVFNAPIDLDLPNGDRVVPDLVIVPDASVKRKRLVGDVLLIVEIVSPGSTTHDRVTKRAVYAEAGIPGYWIVDPERGHVLALRLGASGAYEPYLDATGPVEIDWPVRAAFDVAALARR